MRWPWVSRQLYQAALETILEERAHAHDLYEGLLEKYHALAIQRAPTREGRPQAEMPERKPSLLDDVIREQAGSDPRLVMHFRTYASKLRNEARAKGEAMTDEDIAQHLLSWTTTEQRFAD